MVRAIFFDAGGTLMFPDRQRTLAPLHAHGISFTEEQIHSAERAARRYRDASAHLPVPNVDRQYWVTYYQTLLGETGDEALVSELVDATQNSGNWSYVLPGTRHHLVGLKRNYRLAVISNSDGRISKAFERVGLADCFEAIIDSGNVGHQKPSPLIFQAALNTLGVPAAESVYVGDVYSIDYLGAKSVGMQAILIDPYGTYSSNGVPCIRKLDELGIALKTIDFP